MKINIIKNSTLSSKGFFPTLREQVQERENPYALREDLIKPLPPEGHLVKTNILNAPKHFIEGIAYDLKSLKKGWNGTANDHELGKLNSIALVTGGTALATYLATRRQTASSKAMEFVGISSFLASMALWPVIAIQIPTKLIHGFNVRQHYKDSMDREKLFFNDPQYLPWDLYSEEEIHKIGDYMNVPQDMNNRRDYIQEKMKKIATQDNTLWMLTAGFGVPIMSAIICNRLEQPVKDICGRIQSEQNKKILNKALNTQIDFENTDMYRKLDTLLELHNGKNINDDIIKQICDVIGYESNPLVDKKLKTELKNTLTKNTAVLNPEDGDKILKLLEKNLKSGLKNQAAVSAVLPNLEELSTWLIDGDFINKDLKKGDFVKLNTHLTKKLLEKLDTYNQNTLSENVVQRVDFLEAMNNFKSTQSPVHKFRLTHSGLQLTGNVQTMLKNLVKELVSVDQKSGIVKEYIFKELSAAQETTLANVWNKSMGEIFGALNIPWNKMDVARSNRDMMMEVVRDSMDRIAADKKEYEKVMTKLAQVAQRLETFDNVVSDKGNITFFEQTIGKVLDPAAKSLEKLGFTDTASALAAENGSSEKTILKAFASNRLLSVKSTIYRIITALDMHRRIATSTNIDESLLNSNIAREVKEEIVELSKRTTLGAHRSDFAVKFFFNGNPHPDLSDTSALEIKDGKVVNKYYRAGRAEYRDVSTDTTLYKGTMGLIYDGQVHPETEKLLGKKTSETINNYRHDCLHSFGDEYYFVKPESFISELNGGGINYNKPKFKPTSNKYKFLLTGVSMDDLAMKYANQKHNARAWMKMFGGIGLGVLGVTIASQFFFGKTPKPKEQVQA